VIPFNLAIVTRSPDASTVVALEPVTCHHPPRPVHPGALAYTPRPNRMRRLVMSPGTLDGRGVNGPRDPAGDRRAIRWIAGGDLVWHRCGAEIGNQSCGKRRVRTRRATGGFTRWGPAPRSV